MSMAVPHLIMVTGYYLCRREANGFSDWLAGSTALPVFPRSALATDAILCFYSGPFRTTGRSLMERSARA